MLMFISRPYFPVLGLFAAQKPTPKQPYCQCGIDSSPIWRRDTKRARICKAATFKAGRRTGPQGIASVPGMLIQ